MSLSSWIKVQRPINLSYLILSEDSFIVDNSPNEKPPCFVYFIRMRMYI